MPKLPTTHTRNAYQGKPRIVTTGARFVRGAVTQCVADCTSVTVHVTVYSKETCFKSINGSLPAKSMILLRSPQVGARVNLKYLVRLSDNASAKSTMTKFSANVQLPGALTYQSLKNQGCRTVKTCNSHTDIPLNTGDGTKSISRLNVGYVRQTSRDKKRISINVQTMITPSTRLLNVNLSLIHNQVGF